MSRTHFVCFIFLLLHCCHASHLSRRAQISDCPDAVRNILDEVVVDVYELAGEGFRVTSPPTRTDEGRRLARLWAEYEGQHERQRRYRRGADAIFWRVYMEAASSLPTPAMPPPMDLPRLAITCEDVDDRCRSQRLYAYRSAFARGDSSRGRGRQTTFVLVC